jgi:putative ATP-dependent endonuclease of OLD family
MVRLADVTLVNFRSCQNVTVKLADFTPLVGCNNVGKTNILRGVLWLLRWSSLEAQDYFQVDTPVRVTGTITGIGEPALAQLDPKHRKQIEPFILAEGVLSIRREQTRPDAKARDAALQVRDPKTNSEYEEDAWCPCPTGIEQAIQAILPDPIEVNAMEDVPADVGRNKSTTTLGKLIKTITGQLLANHATDVSEALTKVREQLSAQGRNRSPVLADFDRVATQLLTETYPGLSIRVHIPPPELKTLLADGTVYVSEGSDAWRPIDELGHGAQRSIQMALIRQLAGATVTGSEAGSRTLLLIDEPELYQHPQAVELIRLSLRRLSLGGYQVLCATHSPLIVKQGDAHNTLIVRKDANGATTVPDTLSEAIRKSVADRKAQAKLLFELGNGVPPVAWTPQKAGVA